MKTPSSPRLALPFEASLSSYVMDLQLVDVHHAKDDFPRYWHKVAVRECDSHPV